VLCVVCGTGDWCAVEGSRDECCALCVVQETGVLLKAHVTSVRNVVVMLCHWLLHAFSIIALTQLRDPAVHGSLLCLVPFPAIFYILTVKFTDPSGLDIVS